VGLEQILPENGKLFIYWVFTFKINALEQILPFGADFESKNPVNQ